MVLSFVLWVRVMVPDNTFIPIMFLFITDLTLLFSFRLLWSKFSWSRSSKGVCFFKGNFQLNLLDTVCESFFF